MRSKIETGDLVYIPSEVLLFNESSTKRLKRPTNLLILGQKDGKYQVYHDGETWFVEDSNIYKVDEKDAKVC